MLKSKKQKLIVSTSLLTLSAILLSTASFAWFAMNTKVSADDFKVEAYSDSQFLQIAKTENELDTNQNQTSISYGTKNVEPLRLVTNKTILINDVIYKALNFTKIEQDGSTDKPYEYYDGKSIYYTREDSDADDNNTSGAYNYVQVDPKNLEQATDVTGYYDLEFFEIITSETYTNTGLKYYEKKGNNYVEVKNLGSGDSLKGMFYIKQNNQTAPDPSTLGADAKYTETEAAKVAKGELVYWVKNSDGSFSVASNLTLGTNMNGYYKVNLTDAAVTVDADTVFVADTYYYVANGLDTNGDNTTDLTDYVCLGKPTPAGTVTDSETKAAGYTYWGRAYSTELDDVQADNTLNVLSPTVANADYYLTQTFYIRQGVNTNHASNLRVSDITVGGAYSSMSPALRVLLVATSSSGEVAEVRYDAGLDTIEHSAKATDGSGIMFATLLGDEQETITVEVYIYFDGTDEIAKNTELGVLNGQTVSIEFSIDELDYNKVNP